MKSCGRLALRSRPEYYFAHCIGPKRFVISLSQTWMGRSDISPECSIFGHCSSPNKQHASTSVWVGTVSVRRRFSPLWVPKMCVRKLTGDSTTTIFPDVRIFQSCDEPITSRYLVFPDHDEKSRILVSLRWPAVNSSSSVSQQERRLHQFLLTTNHIAFRVPPPL